jgi:superfamily II DNA or RNA helicase
MQAREAVIRAARFRQPQREAFDYFHDLVSGFDDDLPKLDPARLREQLQDRGLDVPKLPAYLVFALATGVGKTRIAGAIIAYLHLTNQTNNVVILAPRSAVLDKFEREARASSSKYLLLDPSLVPEPHICLRNTIEDFEPAKDQLNLFLLSPQSLTGGDRRIARPREFRGGSLLDYLRDCSDLIVITDEAHHIGTTNERDENPAWLQAVQDLDSRLHIGLTATPRAGEGVNTVYSYPLAVALREKKYTKAVKLWIKNNEHDLTDDDWDHATLDYGLACLDRKRAAIKAYAEEHEDFPFIEPVLLVSAQDTNHAEQVAAWLKEERSLTDEEVLITHSERRLTEADISRLVAIDQPGNKVRVVVNVFRLMEGWDVTNVYVIAPLRAMATFQGAIQSLGRGLRLPIGRRVGDDEVDRLDVVCFGRATLADIVNDAMSQFGDVTEGGPGISIGDADSGSTDGAPTKRLEIPVARTVVIDLPHVRRVDAEPDLTFDVTATPELLRELVTGLDLGTLQTSDSATGIKYTIDEVVRIATARVLADLKYLSPVTHAAEVRRLVRQVVDGIAGGGADEVEVEPIRVAIYVREEIARRFVNQEPTYELTGSSTSLAISEQTLHVPESFKSPIPRNAIGEWS